MLARAVVVYVVFIFIFLLFSNFAAKLLIFFQLHNYFRCIQLIFLIEYLYHSLIRKSHLPFFRYSSAINYVTYTIDTR